MKNQETLEIEKEIKLKKRFLWRYRNNLDCIKRLERKLSLLDEKMKKVRSPNLSGMPRGGTPITIEELMSDKIDLEKRISKLKIKGIEIKETILNEIDRLEDIRYCEVLEARFIDGLTFEEIGDVMGYTERHINNLYKEAIDQLINIETSV